MEFTAFSPGHITGFFQIHIDPHSALRTGSRGSGICLARGVTTRFRSSRGSGVKVFINGMHCPDAMVSKRVIALYNEKCGLPVNTAYTVYHDIDIPLGCGFGTSGAGALSLVFAMDRAFGMGLSFEDKVIIAHRAEVDMRTGLGTVMGEAYGGMDIRLEAGGPGYGKLTWVDVDKEFRVACLLFGKLSTPVFLADDEVKAGVNRYGGRLVDKLYKDRGLENFKRFAREFTLDTGLANDRLRGIIARLDAMDITASMLMFGDGVFVIEKEPGLERAMKVFDEYKDDAEVFTSGIDFEGVHLL